MTSPAPPVVRLCAAFEDLPREECACPGRCRTEQCALCQRDVHYDPKASIPVLGREVIVCSVCLNSGALEQD